MFVAVITIFPDMFAALRHYGITGRAIAQDRVKLCCINPRDFTTDNYRRVDERPYGGGPGMVMMAQPLTKAIEAAKQQAAAFGCDVDADHCPVVALSPQGDTLAETHVVQMAKLQGMILLCGRYEGIDERVMISLVDRQLSIGDYVLSGGELPAMVLLDSVIRRLPEVMGDAQSAQQDSFVDGLLDCPHYTKPVVYADQAVPDVLLSGHHANIAKWRFVQQVYRTKQRRPDLWQAFIPTSEQRQWLDEANLAPPQASQ